MFSFKFSVYGTFVWILLILLAFIINYIFKPNFKNKYRLMNTENLSAIKIAKNYCDSQNQKVFFKIKHNSFWSQDISHPYVKVEKKDLYSNSIYSIQNIMFKSIIMCLDKNKMMIKQIYFKIICFVISLFLTIFLIGGFWIGVIIFTSLFFLLMIIELLLNNKLIKSSIIEFTKVFSSKLDSQTLKKMIFINNFFIIQKYINVFFISWIEIFIIFKNWGKDE